MKRTKGQFTPYLHFPYLGIAYLLFLFGFLIAGSSLTVEYEFISPVASTPVEAIDNFKVEYKVVESCQEVDCWVDEYSKLYAKSETEAKQIKVKLHFLLYRESKYGADLNCGDGGKSCGPMQFHQATWERMRKQMGEPLGDRYDMRQAIQTTAWAIANGRELEWGPILRGEITL